MTGLKSILIFHGFVLALSTYCCGATLTVDASKVQGAGFTYNGSYTWISGTQGAWVDGKGNPIPDVKIKQLYQEEIVNAAVLEMEKDPALAKFSPFDKKAAVETKLFDSFVGASLSAAHDKTVDLSVYQLGSKVDPGLNEFKSSPKPSLPTLGTKVVSFAQAQAYRLQ